jgi:hypothetical protein
MHYLSKEFVRNKWLFCKWLKSLKFLNGARVEQVDEHLFAMVVVTFEFEAYPEPKVLLPIELKALHDRYESFYKVGDAIGASEGFARQNAKLPKKIKN